MLPFINKVWPTGIVLLLVCWTCCKSSKVTTTADNREYNDTGSVIRTEEKKMKKMLFDTSVVYPDGQKK